jgi:hypothetical protein
LAGVRLGNLQVPAQSRWRSGLRAALERGKTFWLALESFAATRRFAVVVGMLALAAFGIASLAWPLAAGRDADTYLLYYADMWHSRPVFPELMLFRTPVAPLLFGPLLQLGGAVLAEIAMAFCYAAAVVAFSAAARFFSARAAVVTAMVLLVYPPYSALFHGVSSDPVFAAILAMWTLALVATARQPTMRRFAGLGVGVVLLVLTRPSSQVLLLAAIVPFLLAAPLRRRFVYVGVFLGTAVLLLAAWAGVNDARYGDLTVSRTSGAHFPLYRVFVADHLVSPTNGSASTELAAAVRSDLLVREPYRSYRIGLDEFFASSSPRMWSDLVPLSDRTWGWKSGYSTLRRVALEAIRSHPFAYAHAVAGTVKDELTSHYRLRPARQASADGGLPQSTIVVDGRTLPRPTEGEPIPASNLWWLASTPDERIATDWSNLADPRLVFREHRDAAAYDRLERRLQRLRADLPDRAGSSAVTDVLNGISSAFPPMLVWIAAGLIALAVRRPRGALVGLALCGFALALLLASALGEPSTIEYRIPLDPIFVLFAAVMLFGRTREKQDSAS